MPPPDESTSLLPEASPSVNWRQKGGKCCYWFCCCGYFLLLLLLLALVALSLADVILTSESYLNITEDGLPENTTIPTWFLDLLMQFDMQYIFVVSIIRNGIDILVCWIFLVIVTRSPRFVGCSTIIKNLIRLANFWTLVCLLVLYILGGALAFLFPGSFLGKSKKNTKTYYIFDLVMETLDVFTKVALVGVLNYVQVRNVASPVPELSFLLALYRG